MGIPLTDGDLIFSQFDGESTIVDAMLKQSKLITSFLMGRMETVAN